MTSTICVHLAGTDFELHSIQRDGVAWLCVADLLAVCNLPRSHGKGLPLGSCHCSTITTTLDGHSQRRPYRIVDVADYLGLDVSGPHGAGMAAAQLACLRDLVPHLGDDWKYKYHEQVQRCAIRLQEVLKMPMQDLLREPTTSSITETTAQPVTGQSGPNIPLTGSDEMPCVTPRRSIEDHPNFASTVTRPSTQLAVPATLVDADAHVKTAPVSCLPCKRQHDEGPIWRLPQEQLNDQDEGAALPLLPVPSAKPTSSLAPVVLQKRARYRMASAEIAALLLRQHEDDHREREKQNRLIQECVDELQKIRNEHQKEHDARVAFEERVWQSQMTAHHHELPRIGQGLPRTRLSELAASQLPPFSKSHFKGHEYPLYRDVVRSIVETHTEKIRSWLPRKFTQDELRVMLVQGWPNLEDTINKMTLAGERSRPTVVTVRGCVRHCMKEAANFTNTANEIPLYDLEVHVINYNKFCVATGHPLDCDLVSLHDIQQCRHRYYKVRGPEEETHVSKRSCFLEEDDNDDDEQENKASCV